MGIESIYRTANKEYKFKIPKTWDISIYQDYPKGWRDWISTQGLGGWLGLEKLGVFNPLLEFPKPSYSFQGFPNKGTSNIGGIGYRGTFIWAEIGPLGFIQGWQPQERKVIGRRFKGFQLLFDIYFGGKAFYSNWFSFPFLKQR